MTLWTLIFGLFVTCAVVQVYYFLKVFSPLAFRKSSTSLKEKRLQPVSVLICAHNELVNLKVLIPTLQQQSYPQFQVVIALDRCTDGSETWLKQLGWEQLKLVIIRETPDQVNSKKYALLQAIEVAAHPILLLTDADCYPTNPLWIQTMINHFDHHTDLVLGYSPYEKQPGLLNLFIRYETLLTGMQYLSRAISGHPYMGVGRNMAYKKSFFESTENLRPFMEVTGGDDDLFVNNYATANNTKVCIEKESMMISKPKTELSAFLRQKKRHLSVGKRYKYSDKLVLGIFSLTHIIFWSSLVSLLVTSTHLAIVIALLVFRHIALSIIVSRTSHRLGDRFNLGALPFVDFLYSVYYLYIGLVALTAKKVTWH